MGGRWGVGGRIGRFGFGGGENVWEPWGSGEGEGEGNNKPCGRLGGW